MSQISRRSVAKGAAWSVPAVAVASAAPAVAASPECDPAKGTLVPPAVPMTLQPGNTISVTSIVTGNGTYKNGSYITVSAGAFVVPNSVTYTNSCTGKPMQTFPVTGYYLNWGDWNGACNAAPGTGAVTNVTNGDGTAYEGRLTLSTPTGCSAQTAGAGLVANLGLQTSIPYSILVCDKTHNLGSVSIPFTITYLNGLTPIKAPVGRYNLNVQFKTGCQPNYYSTWSFSSLPTA